MSVALEIRQIESEVQNQDTVDFWSAATYKRLASIGDQESGSYLATHFKFFSFQVLGEFSL